MKYKDNVLPIVRSVREIALSNWGKVDAVGSKSPHPGDIVTEIDGKIEKILREELSKIYPDIAFVGEEGGGDRNVEKFWLVDPIDGTGHYLRGLPFCTVMIALIEYGEVTFSAIYDFLNDDMYWAEKGQGAYKNNESIHVSDRRLSESYIAVETHMAQKINQEYLGKLDKITGHFHTIDCGWELAMVACGKLDGRISFDGWGQDYDFAPGALIVAEAGGVVTNLNSNLYDYKNINLIAANPKVHSELEEIFKNYKLPN